MLTKNKQTNTDPGDFTEELYHSKNYLPSYSNRKKILIKFRRVIVSGGRRKPGEGIEKMGVLLQYAHC